MASLLPLRLLRVVVMVFLIGMASLPIQSQESWRSVFYPEDWTPEHSDDQGRFLHDFSYAGYHLGEKPLPESVPGPRLDVTQEPYNADNTGVHSATTAIQRAINDVGRAGGGTVYLPAGTYRLTFALPNVPAALLLAHSHVVIQGDGVDETFLFLDETFTRGKSILRVEPVTGVNWRLPADGVVQQVRQDVDSRGTTIPLDGTPQFSVGEWVVIQYDMTPAWIEEHHMSDGWDSSIGGPSFLRKVTHVDSEDNSIRIDIPLRYPVKVRDNARIYRVNEPLSEVGLADFSIGMRENPKPSGWGNNDHGTRGNGAYDVHSSIAIAFSGVVNGWMRDVSTYKPEGNAYAHIHSIGFSFGQSRSLTIRRVSVENPQYRGGGGNGYPILIGSQESLYDDVRAINGRHNFTISGHRVSGNVIYRGYIQNGTGFANPVLSSPADFHAYLSMANLIDNLTIDGDLFEARDRSSSAGVAGFPKHGVTTTQSVFWNIIGLNYDQGRTAIIRSNQYGWGYVIGTRGPASQVLIEYPNPRTAPQDVLEGQGRGAYLQPQSLYVDQLERRLRREGKEHLWEAIRHELAVPSGPVCCAQKPKESPGQIPDIELPLIHETNFNDTEVGGLPQGWVAHKIPQSPDTPYVIESSLEAEASNQNRVLFIGRTADTSKSTGIAMIHFPSVWERLRISFDVYTVTSERNLRITMGGTSDRPPETVHTTVANAGIMLVMSAGRINSLKDAASNAWNYVAPYKAGQWHNVVLDIDVAAQTFNLYLDGWSEPENPTPIPFYTNQYQDINTIGIAYQSVGVVNNTDPVYIDNLTIWGK